jgi:NarL family two-component system response regulator LiaR
MVADIITVLIVDDHPIVRKGLVTFISSFPDLKLVGEAEDATSGMEIYRRECPQVVLMDLLLPDMDGAAAIRMIRQEFPSAAILALSASGDEELIEAALRAGARGFLSKLVSISELAEAIRQVQRGRMILDVRASEIMQRLLSTNDAPASAPSSKKGILSEREQAVLTLLVQGQTNKQISTCLDIQLSTVKQYIGNILSKLRVRSRTEAVAVALKLGLVESK